MPRVNWVRFIYTKFLLKELRVLTDGTCESVKEVFI